LGESCGDDESGAWGILGWVLIDGVGHVSDIPSHVLMGNDFLELQDDIQTLVLEPNILHPHDVLPSSDAIVGSQVIILDHFMQFLFDEVFVRYFPMLTHGPALASGFYRSDQIFEIFELASGATTLPKATEFHYVSP
jgi:hypothetical protein